jgi:hypothetical protein
MNVVTGPNVKAVLGVKGNLVGGRGRTWIVRWDESKNLWANSSSAYVRRLSCFPAHGWEGELTLCWHMCSNIRLQGPGQF